MRAADYVGMTVLVNVACMPHEFIGGARNAYAAVKVVGYSDDTLIIDGMGFGWVDIDRSDIIIEACADYWCISIEDIEEIIK